MSLATDTNECMFFSGGNDFKVSNADAGVDFAGGCTKEWWDGQDDIDTVQGKKDAMAKLMNTDGSPIRTTSQRPVLIQADGLKIADTGALINGVEAGMLVNLVHTDYEGFDAGDGIYEITSVDSSGYTIDTLMSEYSSGQKTDSDFIVPNWVESPWDVPQSNWYLAIENPPTGLVADRFYKVINIVDMTHQLCEIDDATETPLTFGTGSQSPSCYRENTTVVKSAVGGAWSDPDVLAVDYIDALAYSQEILVNKTWLPTTKVSLSNWSGDYKHNTWFKVQGFNRVPGDITDSSGLYYQTILDMDTSGIDADKLADIDLSSLVGDLFDPSWSENVILEGFNICGGVDGQPVFEEATGLWRNCVISHCAIESTGREYFSYGNVVLFRDCHIRRGDVKTDDFFSRTTATGILIFDSNIFANMKSIVCQDVGGHIIIAVDNLIKDDRSESGYTIWGNHSDGSLFFGRNNTVIGLSQPYGYIRSHSGGIAVLTNELVTCKSATITPIVIGKYGGSAIAKNLCAYSETGEAVNEVMRLETGSEPVRLNEIEGLLEVDPQLDGVFLPRNKQILLGGTTGVNGKKTTMGAVAQEHQFAGRSGNANPGRVGIIR